MSHAEIVLALDTFHKAEGRWPTHRLVRQALFASADEDVLDLAAILADCDYWQRLDGRWYDAPLYAGAGLAPMPPPGLAPAPSGGS